MSCSQDPVEVALCCVIMGHPMPGFDGSVIGLPNNVHFVAITSMNLRLKTKALPQDNINGPFTLFLSSCDPSRKISKCLWMQVRAREATKKWSSSTLTSQSNLSYMLCSITNVHAGAIPTMFWW
eukprot:CAMPEP_0172837380 /NCGR_PEP_ID=MMETSP1075-20121228/27152_1 /TAXON_ID=2916 /ORGANISM="Ceratium fusus, Strain PA161109" /LENGTH=123 /DNA_ID=CAMNT_0013680753 /DNA_START=319 /DNA_END=690 /DNA_ORIENTATION=-